MKRAGIRPRIRAGHPAGASIDKNPRRLVKYPVVRRLLAALAASVSLGTAAVSAQPAPEAATIRIASAPDDDVTPVLYAQRSGLFAKAGLTVVVDRMNNGAAVSAAVAGEAVDIGKSSTMPLVLAHARGFPFTLIAPANLWLSQTPVTALIVPRASTVTDAKDLAGKTISSSGLNDLMSISVRLWLAEHGADVAAVRFVEIPSSSVLSALDDGRVDGAVVGNPNLARDLATGRYRILAATEDAIAHRFLVAAWFANADYVARNRIVVQRFLAVLYRAQAYTSTHPAETVDALAAFTGIDAGLIAQMTRATPGALLDPRDLAPVIDAAVKAKVIDHGFDPRQMISPAALKAAP